ncbi:MAG: hypothetical protein KAT70_03770 [Thermoplasmata archaeon]|nr:hypothetical protein [Thermoplasmata archaeon]
MKDKQRTSREWIGVIFAVSAPSLVISGITLIMLGVVIGYLCLICSFALLGILLFMALTSKQRKEPGLLFSASCAIVALSAYSRIGFIDRYVELGANTDRLIPPETLKTMLVVIIIVLALAGALSTAYFLKQGDKNG